MKTKASKKTRKLKPREALQQMLEFLKVASRHISVRDINEMLDRFREEFKQYDSTNVLVVLEKRVTEVEMNKIARRLIKKIDEQKRELAQERLEQLVSG